MNELLEAQLTRRTRAEWIPLLRTARVPAGAVNTVGEALDSDQVRANDLVVQMQHPRLGSIPVIGFPTKFDRTPCDIRRPPPDIGEHTDEIRHAKKF
jgi:crotonobetainyl-CoA:carnitine CoA-transferase CaiB-like acyl-CoA transferase